MDKWTKLLLAAGAVGVGAWWLTRLRGRPADYDFRGKVVLITGGSRGLGLVLARKLAAQGARIAICGRDPDEVERAGQDLAGHGDWPLALPCDVTNATQVHDLVQAVEAHFGRVDVLINNAGIIQVGPYSAMTRADFDEAMNINFWGAYNATEAVLPGMRRRGEGRIVNISSVGGKVSVPHLLPYCASKFALTGYSHGLRAELAPEGIVVTTVCPWLMRTGSPRHALVKGRHESEYALFKISDSLPLLTLGAEEAADRILAACARGDAETLLALPAQTAARLHALLPELVAGVLEFVQRLLPVNGPGGEQVREGKDCESTLAPALLTAAFDQAARQNNEMAPAEY
jgi:NAD(P)-dependent dehydrogenase (short-subunit alcohol dehydrogenase family)